MPFLIGTDEAGYGPNLGPLVITGTLWKVPEASTDLYQQLGASVSQSTCKQRLTVCDSKSIYSSGSSIANLETSVLAMIGELPPDLNKLAHFLGCGTPDPRMDPWLLDAQLPLPVAAELNRVQDRSSLFHRDCQEQEVQLVGVISKTVFANQFNQLVEQHGNKATVLTFSTLQIVQSLLRQTGDEDVFVTCDKHGGRSKYAGVLQHCLTEQPISVERESLESSAYYWEQQGRAVSVEFKARGESSLPVAMASMVSKYVRELYMMVWNRFWQTHLPQLRPTKGYPQDAKRFMMEIEGVRNQLKISRESVWRCR